MKRWVFCRWRNVENDSADVTSAGRSFQIRGPTTGKARLATVNNLTGGTTRRLVPEERRARRQGRSATRSSGPRYCGASPYKTLYARMAMCNLTRSGTRSQWRHTSRVTLSPIHTADATQLSNCVASALAVCIGLMGRSISVSFEALIVFLSFRS